MTATPPISATAPPRPARPVPTAAEAAAAEAFIVGLLNFLRTQPKPTATNGRVS